MESEPEESTSVHTDAFPAARSTARADPRLHWSDASGEHVAVIDRRKLIGAASGVDIVVNAPGVSRIHAALEPGTDGGLWIRDLASRNGTYVGGIRVSGARVPDGGQIRLGGTDLVLRYDQIESPIALWPRERFGPLLGRSTIMREMFAQLARLAQLDTTVLIQGETGTGKELVARAIHDESPRSGKPMVVVDCAALPENLLDAELFGHTKGAFTGAIAARAGAIEAADGGTVFLDEIGELPLAMQPKLLRAIEGRMVRRVGETGYREVDVRFISATHRDLCSMVNAGAFREDLYFRLAVLPINVPPLRARTDDIPLLAASFLPSGSARDLSAETVRELCTRPWMGNVRELRNFVERAIALGTDQALAMQSGTSASRPPAPPPPAVSPGALTATESFPVMAFDEPFSIVRDRWLDHLEKEYMRTLVERHGRDTNAIAQAAGLDRSYVYRLIRKHEL